MDVNKILELIKDIPQDKWQDERTIRRVIKVASKDSGKEYSEEEMQRYVKKFQQFASDPAMKALIPFFIKTGISNNQLNKILKKMK